MSISAVCEPRGSEQNSQAALASEERNREVPSNARTFGGIYPSSPGYKEDGASRLAALEAGATATDLRAKCLELLKFRGDLTADECAAMLEKSVLAIRPRLSELFAFGLIHKTAMRRKNASGISATVWTIDPQGKLF